MEWISGLIGIGGLAVAALSLWLNYKDRSSVQRRIIYEKQLDAYRDLIVSLANFTRKATELLPEKYESLDANARKSLKKALSEEDIQVNLEFSRNLLLFSEDVVDNIVRFEDVWSYITTGKNEDWGLLDESKPVAPKGDLSVAYTEVIWAARKALGIRKLSKEILIIVGDKK